MEAACATNYSSGHANGPSNAMPENPWISGFRHIWTQNTKNIGPGGFPADFLNRIFQSNDNPKDSGTVGGLHRSDLSKVLFCVQLCRNPDFDTFGHSSVFSTSLDLGTATGVPESSGGILYPALREGPNQKYCCLGIQRVEILF